VVLLDVGLPGMDGYEVARRLRGPHDEGPRVVALTGYGREEDRRRSRDAGFTDHLVKPVDPEDLRKALGE
jgi:CheY-like chemotaxis protein